MGGGTHQRIGGINNFKSDDSLHPNVAAQFYFQAAVVYASNEKEEEMLEVLYHFEKCVVQLLKEKQTELHGDEYFYLLDEWISRLPLGSMTPRDTGFVRQNMKECLAHPAFAGFTENREFQRLVYRLTEGGERND